MVKFNYPLQVIRVEQIELPKSSHEDGTHPIPPHDENDEKYPHHEVTVDHEEDEERDTFAEESRVKPNIDEELTSRMKDLETQVSKDLKKYH